MKENILMIRKKVKAFSIGLMEENMMENGKMESNMASEFTHLQLEKLKKENGTKEKESTGSVE